MLYLVYNLQTEKEDDNVVVPEITFMNLEESQDQSIILNDLDSRQEVLQMRHKLPANVAKFVLNKFSFSVDAADEALHHDRKAVINSCCPETEDKGVNVIESETVDYFRCDVCFDNISEKDGFELMCNHKFCRDCWKDSFEASSQELAKLACLHHDCNVPIVRGDMNKITSDQELIKQFDRATLENFVVRASEYSFCPGPDCTVVAFCGDSTKAKDVSCKQCDSSFCFLCGDKPHLPVSCKIWRKYQTSVGRLDQREEEVEKKTIACPNCGVGITKNEGCNHIRAHCACMNFVGYAYLKIGKITFVMSLMAWTTWMISLGSNSSAAGSIRSTILPERLTVYLMNLKRTLGV